MFLDSAKIVSLTQQLHRQLKPEPESRRRNGIIFHVNQDYWFFNSPDEPLWLQTPRNRFFLVLVKSILLFTVAE